MCFLQYLLLAGVHSIMPQPCSIEQSFLYAPLFDASCLHGLQWSYWLLLRYCCFLLLLFLLLWLLLSLLIWLLLLPFPPLLIYTCSHPAPPCTLRTVSVGAVPLCVSLKCFLSLGHSTIPRVDAQFKPIWDRVSTEIRLFSICLSWIPPVCRAFYDSLDHSMMPRPCSIQNKLG